MYYNTKDIVIIPQVQACVATALDCVQHLRMPQDQTLSVGFDDVRRQKSVLVYRVSKFVRQCRLACSWWPCVGNNASREIH